MTVSFVVPTRNRAQLLALTLNSILGQNLSGVGIEIFVVDNGSTDGTETTVESLRQQTSTPIVFHKMKVNGGPASSRNYGAGLATGEFIAFIDSDVELLPNWLQGALQAFEQHPQAGMVTGKLVFAASPSTVYCFGGELSRIGFGWDAHQAEPANSLQQSARSLWAPSASLMVRRDLFQQLGGFDEKFFYGYEDSDIGWRFNLAGWDCFCTPQAVALHATTAQIDDKVTKVGDEIVFHYTKNRLRSILRNYGPARLTMLLPLYAAYSLADATLRSPRKAKFRALWWSLLHLKSTLQLRAQTQASRRRGDAELAELFHPRLFPPQRLEARMEALRGLHGPARVSREGGIG